MCVCQRVCMCARACECMYVYTGSGSRLSRLLRLHSGTKTPRETRERARERARRQGRREGGERLSSRGRRWEIRELFSALSHQTPTATEGVAELPARVQCKSSGQQARQSPLFPLLSPTAAPQREGWSLGLLASRAKEKPSGETRKCQITHQVRQRIWRIVCKLK